MDSKLYKAASSGDHDRFVSLINADPSLLHQTTTQKNTVLHIAAEFNCEKIAKEIVQRRRTILYVTNSKEDTALHFAARFGSFQVAEFLIHCAKRYGLEAEKELLTMVNVDKDTALHDAVRNGHHGVVELLLKECPGLACCTNETGESPLFVAVEKEFWDIAREILLLNSHCSYGGREGANVVHAVIIRTLKRYIWSLCETPLRIYLSLPIVYFNSYIPELFKLPYWERNVTRKLSHHEKEFLLELLKNFPHILREADICGWYPLHYAAYLGSEEFIELILHDQTSLAYRRDNMGVSALHIAAKEGRVGAIETFVEICPDTCELLDDNNRTALHVAVENGQVYAVERMLEIPNFVKLVNEQDTEGNTALHLAAICGNYALVIILAADGRVDKKIMNKQGLTTNDIIRLSSKFRWYEKLYSTARLEFKGAVRGMQQILARKPKIEDKPEIENREKSLKKEEPMENVTNDTDRVNIVDKPTKEISQRSHIWSEMSEANLVVATIIATVTFSATFQIPGGYNKSGLAVLREQKYFKLYLISDSLSFGYAAASMFVTFFTGLFGKQTGFSYPGRWVTFLTGSSLWFMVFSFMLGTSAVLPEDSGFAKLVLFVACASFIWPVIFLGAVAVNWFTYFP